ncbi:MAG: homoserine kinase [Bacteroidetes bacterium]|nr:homoserine kinase [Bacteroidota bacterium]
MAIYTKIEASDLEKIVVPYQIEVVDFTPIDGGNANSNYHIRAKEGEYMLTIAEEKSLQQVQNLATLLQWLGEHHFSTSQVHASITGEIVTQYAEKPILVKKWIYGTVHENFSADELRQIGNSMAQLHQIPVPHYLPKLHPYGYQVFSTVIDKRLDTEYEYWLKERLQFLEKNLPENLPRGLVHGDIFFDNVLFENNKIKAIIDFEEACNYYFIFDLGMGVLGLCRTDGKIDLAKTRALIKGYEQVRSLDFLEKDSLQLFIEYGAIATSWWRFWKYNIHSPSLNLGDKHWEMVQVAKEVEILNKEHFLSIVFE